MGLGLSWLEGAGVLGGAFLTLVAVWRTVRPRWRKLREFARKVGVVLDVFLGRPSFVDEATGTPVPAVPPLGKALADLRTTVDEQGRTLSDLTSVVKQVANQQTEILQLRADHNKLSQKVEGHDGAIAVLLGSTFERGAEKNMAAAEQLAAQTDDVIDVEDPQQQEDKS